MQRLRLDLLASSHLDRMSRLAQEMLRPEARIGENQQHEQGRRSVE